MKKIILRLGAQAPEDCLWVKIEADDSSVVGRGSLAELAAGAEGYPLSVLIPGSEVLLTRLRLPVGNRKQMLAAIPYALEESLVAEVEEQHFAVGAADGEGALAVAVIARERLEHWLGLCRAQGLAPFSMTSEVLALPVAESGRALLLGNDGLARFRSGPQDGFVLEVDNLALILQMAEINLLSPALLYQEAEAADAPAELHPFLGEPLRLAEVMPLLAQGLVEKEVINLLQGDYGPQAQWERHWRRWRLPAVLLLALLLVQTGIGIRENSRLRHYGERLSTEISQVYRQTFPEAQRIVNPRAQMEHQLQTLHGSASGGAVSRNFLRLLERSGPILGDGGKLQLHGLSYRSGEMDLDIETKDLQTLDALKGQLAQQGLEVEIRTATTRGGQVQARMQFKEKP